MANKAASSGLVPASVSVFIAVSLLREMFGKIITLNQLTLVALRVGVLDHALTFFVLFHALEGLKYLFCT